MSTDTLGENRSITNSQTFDSLDLQIFVYYAPDRTRRHGMIDSLGLLTNVCDEFRITCFEEFVARHGRNDGIGEVVGERRESDQFTNEVESSEENLQKDETSI